MSSSLNSPDNHIKSRHIRLVPKKCIAIGFGRQNFRSSASLSTISDNLVSEYCCYHQDYCHSPKSPRDTSHYTHHHSAHHSHLNNAARTQSPLVDRQSFSSVSTNATPEHRGDCLCHQPINCVQLFNQFVKQNDTRSCSPYSTNSLSKLDLVGFIYPTTLLVVGNDDTLKTLCYLWSKRILKAPYGFYIRFVGNAPLLEVTSISQVHFTPLAEALHKCIDELNLKQQDATFEAIVKQLHSKFPTMELPAESILRTSLNALVAANKLCYDCDRQVYTAVCIVFNPWDEFENLSLSDNTRNEKDDDEIELEFKNVNKENLTKCANLDKLFYVKSDAISTDTSSIIDYNFMESMSTSKKSLRRNSSLSNEIDKLKSEHKSSFQRSKSFKLNYKRNSEEESLNKKCTCNEIIIKRQSLLSKLLKFGYSTEQTNVKTRSSSSSSSSTLSTKHANFGSQFPEENIGSSRQMISLGHNIERKEIGLNSKATQTIKCGPDDIVTLIMKQSGKHALARNRHNHRHLEQANLSNEECCAQQLHNHKSRCANCQNGQNGISYYVARRKESRSNSSRKGRHKTYHGQIGDCHKYQPDLTAELTAVDLTQNQRLHSKNRENKHRKQRSNSLRYHHRPNELLIDYVLNGKQSVSKSSGKQLSRPDSSYNKYATFSDNDDNNDDHNLDYKGNCIQLYELNDRPTMQCYSNNEAYPNRIGPRSYSDLNSSPQQINHQDMSSNNSFKSYGNVLINNSVKVKIEIETSNLASTVPSEHTDPRVIRNEQQSNLINPVTANRAYLSSQSMENKCANMNNIHLDNININTNINGGMPTSAANNSRIQGTDRIETQFTNDIYSELSFDDQHHLKGLGHNSSNFIGFNHNINHHRNRHPLHSGKSYNCSDLNYANSITALKQQIAQAKANFFNAPLSPSNAT